MKVSGGFCLFCVTVLKPNLFLPDSARAQTVDFSKSEVFAYGPFCYCDIKCDLVGQMLCYLALIKDKRGS